MKQVTLTAIVEAAEDLGFDPFDVQTAYSGRGMFGAKTLAVVGPRGEIEAAISHAANVLTDKVQGMYESDRETVVELKAVRWDQIGKSDYVCY